MTAMRNMGAMARHDLALGISSLQDEPSVIWHKRRLGLKLCGRYARHDGHAGSGTYRIPGERRETRRQRQQEKSLLGGHVPKPLRLSRVK